jgi:capsular exopolysaccharide synthesis family protein
MPQALPAAEQRQLMIYTESIESLRTNLMLTENLGIPGQAKVIAICSAASGEGKTSVATSLGMSIAEATNQPTLVLDADLRAPDIGKFFEVPNQPGVSEVLCNKAEVDQAIHRVGGTQTFVLPAGKQRVNPHHILQGSRINELLETLRGKFSTIIIDTPPVLAASESLVYAQAADLVVFCSLADVSRAKQVRAAVDRLQSTGANIAGAVLSGVHFNRYVYRYGAYTTRA